MWSLRAPRYGHRRHETAKQLDWSCTSAVRGRCRDAELKEQCVEWDEILSCLWLFSLFFYYVEVEMLCQKWASSRKNPEWKHYCRHHLRWFASNLHQMIFSTLISCFSLMEKNRWMEHESSFRNLIFYVTGLLFSAELNRLGVIWSHRALWAITQSDSEDFISNLYWVM